MSDVLNVQKRTETGTLRMRRLRQSGHIPAVLYGHGMESVSLAVSSRDVDAWLRNASHVVELRGDLQESALVKEVQWDAFGVNVMHLDFARVDATEAIEVELQVELKGVAPGTKSGGVVKLMVHQVTVRCPATKLPDRLELNINNLELGDSLKSSDIELEDGVEIVGDPEDVLVACVEPSVTEEVETDADAAQAEPEVIGRKADDEEEGDS